MAVAVAVLLGGCGFYVGRGQGAYTFIGFGYKKVALRCDSRARSGWNIP